MLAISPAGAEQQYDAKINTRSRIIYIRSEKVFCFAAIACCKNHAYACAQSSSTMLLHLYSRDDQQNDGLLPCQGMRISSIPWHAHIG